MLSFMAMDFFQKSPLLVFPLIALALFTSVFLTVVVRTLRTRPSAYARLENLPLETSTAKEAHHG
jgi:hypothetical protein